MPQARENTVYATAAAVLISGDEEVPEGTDYEGGIRILFNGKANARSLARRVRPRVTRPNRQIWDW